MVLMNQVTYGSHSKDERTKMAKRREENLEALRKWRRIMSPDSYDPLEASLLAASELQPRPTYLWGDQALRYLKYILANK